MFDHRSLLPPLDASAEPRETQSGWKFPPGVVGMSFQRSIPFLALFVLTSSVAFEVDGQDNVWRSNGPFGGNIQALAVARSNPQVVYAGTGTGGVFVSTDGAATWTVTSLINKIVTDVAVDEQDSRTACAAVLGGAFKTTDGGASWTDITNGLPDLSLRTIVIDPINTNTVFAGTDGGVFKSTNGGASWAAASTGLASTRIRDLQFSTHDRRALYASAENGGIHKTLDGGSTWIEINEGMGRTHIVSLAFDSANSNVIYAVGFGSGYKTTDNGATWGSLPITGNLAAVAVDPTNSSTIYIGERFGAASRSTDAGASWLRLNNTRADHNVLCIGVGSGVVYFGCDANGVFKTTDQGNTWTETNRGLNNCQVPALALNSSNPNVIYAGTTSGLFKTTDGGTQWVLMPASSTKTEGLAIDPSDPNVLYSVPTALKSSDAGETWENISSGLIDPFNLQSILVHAIAVNPISPNILYAGSFSGIFKTTNRGRKWTKISFDLGRQDVFSLAIDPTNPSIVYAGSSLLHKSTDGGASWNRSIDISSTGSITSIAVDPTQTSVLYIGAQGGAFASTDAGAHWTRLAVHTETRSFQVPAVAVSSSSPNILYAGTLGGGVFRSGDRGTTWEQVNDGLTNLDVMSLAVDPRDPNLVFAGTRGGGVFSAHLRFKPKITAISTSGKNLIVAGQNFQAGSKIVMNNEDRKTLTDDQNPNALIGKKLLKQITRGDTVSLQVRNPDGQLSDSVAFTRPSQ
jgi:photosystem II stability/assembly factor-like uncharacterized protein